MNSFKISPPLVHKKSSLPTFGAMLTFIASIPVIMVLWVAICSQFTRVEGTNETALYNVYVVMRALFAISAVAGAVIYDMKRASAAVIPAAALGFISSVFKVITNVSTYLNKKALAESLSIHSNYTQNYLDIAEAVLLMLTALFVCIYLLGLIKTGFPVVLVSIVSVIIVLYSVISYSTTYPVNDFNVLSRCYSIPYCLGVLLFCISSKTKAQIEGKVKKEKYVPRRMRK